MSATLYTSTDVVAVSSGREQAHRHTQLMNLPLPLLLAACVKASPWTLNTLRQDTQQSVTCIG